MKYEAVLHGEVQKPGLGPLHTEFDGNGNAYTSFFVSSEIVKWNVKDLKVLDRVPTYYSIGHLSVPGGPTSKPHGKYVIAYNKITKDRYLPTGPINWKTTNTLTLLWVMIMPKWCVKEMRSTCT